MLKRTKAALLAVALAAVAVVILLLNAGPSERVHVVVIPQGAFIPPSNWRPGELVFSDRYYSPSNLTIAVGDKVKWVNRDSVTHTVTHLAERKLFDKVLNPRESFEMVFNTPGRFTYTCTIHPWQGGVVEVRPS